MSRKTPFRNLWFLQVASDLAALVAAYYTTFLIRFHSEWGEMFFSAVNRMIRVRETGLLDDMFEDFYLSGAFRIIVRLALVLGLLYALRDLYPGRRYIRKRPVVWDIIVANVLALAFFYAYFYLQRNVFHPRSFLGTVIFLNIIYCTVFRKFLDLGLAAARSRFGVDRVRTVLAGSGPAAEWIEVLIRELHPHGLEVAGRCPYDGKGPFEDWLKQLESAAVSCRADLLVLADADRSVSEIMRVLELANRLDVSVKVCSDKMEVLVNQAGLSMDLVRGVPLVHFEAPSPLAVQEHVRKILSFVLAGVALVVMSPLMLAITLLIKGTSRGPAVFVQERIGINRKPFRMFKFRTMYDRADELQKEVEEFNESGGGLFKIRKDPRVTPVGRFLRRFSLDELPQLINVIRGEMTIVGPRPLPRRDFENYYEEWHYSRHEGMPGLTCLWQISGRSDVDFHSMCILDVYYLRNRNWILDLKIILRTFWVVLFAKGAY